MLGHGTCVAPSAKEVYSYAVTWQFCKNLVSKFSSILPKMRLHFLRKQMTSFISPGLDACTNYIQLQNLIYHFSVLLKLLLVLLCYFVFDHPL